MDKQEINLFEYFEILWQRRSFLLKSAILLAIFSVIFVLMQPLWFKATAIILPPAGAGGGFANMSFMSDMGFGNLFGNENDNNRFLAILKTKNLRKKVITQFDLQKKYNIETLQETFDALNENMQVDQGDEMQIKITMWDQDQDIVADMVNYTVQVLDSLNIALSIQKAHQNRQFIEQRIQDVNDTLRILQNNLVATMESSNILSLDDQIVAGVEKSGELLSTMIAKEIELKTAIYSMGENNPKVELIKYELRILRAKYAQFFKGGVEIESLIPPLDQVPKMKIQFTEMTRRIEYYGKLLTFLGPQYEQARIDEVKDIPTLQVIDKAIRPDKKDKPTRSIMVLLICGVGGILVSVGVIIYEVEYLPTIRKRETDSI